MSVSPGHFNTSWHTSPCAQRDSTPTVVTGVVLGTCGGTDIGRPRFARLRIRGAFTIALVIAAFLIASPIVRAGEPLTRNFQASGASAVSLPIVRIVIDQPSITYAQRVRVRLIVITAPGNRITWPILPDELGAFSIAAATEPSPAVLTDLPTTPDGGVSIATQRVLTLEPAIAESHEVPPLEFVIGADRAGAKPVVILTASMPITVRSVLPARNADGAASAPSAPGATVPPSPNAPTPADPASPTTPPSANAPGAPAPEIDPGAMRDIAPIAPDRDWQPWYIGSIAAVAAGGLAYASMRLVRHRTPRTLAPRDVARSRLATLYTPAGTLTTTPAAAMQILDDTLRSYLVATFSLNGGDRTTARLRDSLSSHPSVPLAELTRMLEQFDVAKFSGKPVHDSDVKAARDDVEALIAMTTLHEASSGADPSASGAATNRSMNAATPGRGRA